ncbi:MAG TPA: PASTA domain-containing protein, partial [Jiangellaceae bacterium]|nr:PASTA domain-containing protein [Jiangellaceae bacterium]
QALVAAGLGVNVKTQDTCQVPENQVMGQKPGAGTEVDPGTTVEITVAQPPPNGCGNGNSGGGD